MWNRNYLKLTEDHTKRSTASQEPELVSILGSIGLSIQAVKASEGISSILVHASSSPSESTCPAWCSHFVQLTTTFCISKGINVHLHQKPNQTTQNYITTCFGFMGTRSLMVSDELIKLTHVQVELGCTGCSVKAGSSYFTMHLGSSVLLPARMSQNGGKHTEIHHKHQVIHFLALNMESISSSSRAVCLYPTSSWHFAVF